MAEAAETDMAFLRGQLSLLVPMIERLIDGQRRLEDRVTADIRRLEAKVETAVTDLKADIAQVERRVDSAVAELKADNARIEGKVDGALDQIGQRISDLNSRLPVTLGYTPPDRKAS